MQSLYELDVDIACVTEPASVPPTPRWAISTDKLAAIYIKSDHLISKCVTYKINMNFVVIKYERIHVFSIYIAPSEDRHRFNVILDELSAVIRTIDGDCIITGDFNAKSVLWGSPSSNFRGMVLERWAAGFDFRIINVGNTPTCVRHNGHSIVDLTWSSANICGYISDWQVLQDALSLSDHRYITFSFGSRFGGHTDRRARYPRWNAKTLVKELFSEVVHWLCDGGFPADSVEGFSRGVARVMSSACDVAAFRLNYRDARRGVYWWSEEISQARRRCLAARRLLTRVRGRGGSCTNLEDVYKKSRSTLCKLIKRSKAKAWESLIDTLEDDPWGLPYRIVMDRLRRSGPSFTEFLEPTAVNNLLDDLFPVGETHNPLNEWRDWNGYDPELRVTAEEVREAIRGRKRGGCPAPGPDGISLVFWKAVPGCMLEVLASLFSLCLEKGEVPSCWKVAILVLIPKGKIDINLPKARPICLLNEVGKFFERILDRRLKAHMATLPGLRMPSQDFTSGMQYGFRAGISTVDALDAVTNYIRNRMHEGKIVLAVSLDIKNAFNSLSWCAIRWVLRLRKYPEYLRRIIDNYLYERSVEYLTSSGIIESRVVSRGVPQGSVLGPLLWNIAYDYVLRVTREYRGCSIIGYADDTLIMSTGKFGDVVQYNTNVFIKIVLKRIDFLGLCVAPEKTDVVLFRKRNRRLNRVPAVRVGNVAIRPKDSMKYLGVILDNKLNFRKHFIYIDEKVGKVTRALGRLMPNLRGPSERKRKLYAGIIASVVLYAAPIWADSLLASGESRRLFRRWQRATALRVCSAYRSVSYDSATLLARQIPLELLAAERTRVYWRVQDAREAGTATPEVVSDIKRTERVITQRQWKIFISRPDAAGVRLRDAILPHLDIWMTRAWGALTFRVTQLLTGHGCFGTFLKRIGKEAVATCPFCFEEDDSAEHTISGCAEWNSERGALTAVIGPDLTLPGIVRAICTNKEGWIAFSRFSETVMRSKEDAERAREAAGLRSPVPFDPG